MWWGRTMFHVLLTKCFSSSVNTIKLFQVFHTSIMPDSRKRWARMAISRLEPKRILRFPAAGFKHNYVAAEKWPLFCFVF